MIEHIFQENWNELKTQTGDASYVPEAILGLLSNDEGEFDKAYWRLENHIVVQSDLYSSAAVVPKYLEEVFLKSKFKYGVLELLFQIGGGYSSDVELAKTCFGEVVKVYNLLLSNPLVKGSEYEKTIKEDLAGLYEMKAE